MNRPGGTIKRSGFTLIELLVVVAIIGMLAKLLLPALSHGKASAISVLCKSNLHEVGIALRLYLDDAEKYPHSWHLALSPYLGNKAEVVYCPAWKPAAVPQKVLYGYNGYNAFNGGLGLVPESGVRVPNEMIAIGDSCDLGEITGAGFGWPGCFAPPDHKDRRSNMLFCDGHVESSGWTGVLRFDPLRIRRWFLDNEPHSEIWSKPSE